MGLLWADVRLALIIIVFMYLLQWTVSFTKSKSIGLILAAVIAYLTFYQHYGILIFVLIFFFGYPFFEKLAEGFG
jgi:hypothetical protein